MKELSFRIFDVFTDTPFAGNPLAIVEDADDLDTAQMQTIAREFNLSETIFLMAPRDAAHTARARIFFPTAEIPFAGHPTVGAALFLAGKHGLDHVTLEEEAGLVPVTIADGAATFCAPVTPFAHPFEADAALAAAALDITPEDIGPHNLGVYEGGPRFAYVPVNSRDALRRARPIEPHWSALMAACAVDSAYLYTPDYHARMFSPTAGIPEDPATGSASAILAAQLLENGALSEGQNTLELHQGEDMGRPSRIGLSVSVTQGRLGAIHVTGRAVPISRGYIRIPAAAR